jgi:carotenoid cleavage dioxygenase
MKYLLPAFLCFQSAAAFSLSTTISAGTIDKTRSLTEKDILQIQQEKEREARNSHNNEVFNALFVSVPERKEPVLVHDISNRPKDFPAGALLRLGPNGASKTDGFLDGDGLLHCVTFPSNPDAPLTYSSAYIETVGRKLEEEKGAKFTGSLGAAPYGLPLLGSVVQNMINFQIGTKDTCNTALAESGGRLLSLMEQAPPSEIEILKDGRIRTIASKINLDGAIPASDPVTGGSFSAHGRTCPKTGERIHVSYGSSSKPYARVDIFDQGWKLKRTIPINDLTSPVMIHDCAITENYILVLDFPLTVRPLRMLQNKFPVEYEPENGARIGLVPRNNDLQQEVKWFDCKPGVILHAANAYETDDGKIVFHALRSEPTGESYITSYSTSFLYEWIMDLKSGTIDSEKCLNAEELVEFPIIDERLATSVANECYAVGVQSIGGPLTVYKNPGEGILIDRVVKFSLVDNVEEGIQKGDVIGRFKMPPDFYGVTEPTIVPKLGSGKGSYCVVVGTQVPETDVPSHEDIEKNGLISRIFVVDCEALDAGAVWEFDLPYHLPYGLHSGFLNWEDMK